MNINEILNIPEDIETDLICEVRNDKVKFTIGDFETSWLNPDDSFIARISFDNLNRMMLDEHISKEIEIKNRLDEGTAFLNKNSYLKAVKCFDDVIYYDSCYGEALLKKSKALEGQGHFVKALRHYKRAVKCDENLKDVEYHKNLIRKANDERDSFPKIKQNIYTGDELFTKGEYEKAVSYYDRALNDPSKFRDKISSKLLNKKATALIKLEKYEDALNCFEEALDFKINDYSYFGRGLCQYNLGVEVSNEFRNPLKITKEQSLRQVMALNDLEMFSDSLKISNILLKNHFKVDDYYFRLLKAKMNAIECLGLDFTEVENILDSLY